jgi:beta-glucosidase/6-phospho-beta-glucosidase/beta-galactosidase
MTKDFFYGVGEPLIQRELDQGINAPEYLELIKGMGCNAYRSWMHITEILKDYKTPDEDMVKRHTRLLDKAVSLGMEVTGMSHEWFLPEGCKQKKGHAMPERDLSDGSLYMQTLRMLEKSWEIIASLFPQVKIWEVGNEWNLNAFLHPDGFLDSDMSNPFSPDEKIDIAIDLMYFSAKGIRKGNPDARVASFLRRFQPYLLEEICLNFCQLCMGLHGLLKKYIPG